MRLEAIDIGVVRRAIDIYLAFAYPDGPGAKKPRLNYEGAQSAAEIINQFQDESHYTEDVLSHRYILRLGNRSYPHMKLVLEEFMVKGEYFFTVDSHDEMVKLAGTSADWEAWQNLRAVNARVKEQIEVNWQEAGIPTFKDMKALMPAGAPPEAAHKGRILIVDDERDVVETTRTLLAMKGFDVETAFDGYEALEKIRRKKPKIVLLDIMLPGMDGYEVCSKIKRNAESRDIAVLLVTAGTGEMIATREADGFLVKPFKQEVLLSFIEHLLHPPAPDSCDA